MARNIPGWKHYKDLRSLQEAQVNLRRAIYDLHTHTELFLKATTSLADLRAARRHIDTVLRATVKAHNLIAPRKEFPHDPA